MLILSPTLSMAPLGEDLLDDDTLFYIEEEEDPMITNTFELNRRLWEVEGDIREVKVSAFSIFE